MDVLQAVAVAFVSSALNGDVSWGDRTHWRLKLLLSPWFAPLYLITGAPKHSLCLGGPNNSWGIAVFPARGGSAEGSSDAEVGAGRGGGLKTTTGAATPRHAHIDGGRMGLFQRDGIPPLLSGVGGTQELQELMALQMPATQALIQVRTRTRNRCGCEVAHNPENRYLHLSRLK